MLSLSGLSTTKIFKYKLKLTHAGFHSNSKLCLGTSHVLSKQYHILYKCTWIVNYHYLWPWRSIYRKKSKKNNQFASSDYFQTEWLTFSRSFGILWKKVVQNLNMRWYPTEWGCTGIPKLWFKEKRIGITRVYIEYKRRMDLLPRWRQAVYKRT